MSILRVEGLKYKYPDTDKLVLNDISFSVEKGEFTGLIGQNNAGKSTLCYALAGLVPQFFKGAYGGKVLIDGLEVGKENVREMVGEIGLVFENPFSQITGSKYTVFEEIAFGLENIGVERCEMIDRVKESLSLLDITELKEKNPFGLSGGQMQRVAIASVIALAPDVLILDEPTSQLDPKGSGEVFKVVEKLAARGMTIVMAEHEMEKIAEYADNILLLDDGRCIDYAPPEAVFSRPDLADCGIEPPIVTKIARELGIKKRETGYYPVKPHQLTKEDLVNRYA